MLSCIATVLPVVDIHFFIYPVIRQYLKFDINEINVETLEKSVKSPLDRELFYSSASLLAPSESKRQENASNDMLARSASEKEVE